MKSPDRFADDIVDKAMVARIATVSRTGRPHVNPLYFVIEPSGPDEPAHVLLGTAVSTLAARNVTANPAVQILFENERVHGDRIVRMDGLAVVRTDPPLLARYRRAVTRKYIVTPAGLWNMAIHPRQWGPTRRHVGGGGACVIEVTPTAVELITASLP